jgi:hypothetical protein
MKYIETNERTKQKEDCDWIQFFPVYNEIFKDDDRDVQIYDE